jgi:hypothetical protein
MESEFLDVMAYSLQSGEPGWFAECSSSKCDVDGGEGLIGDSLADTMAYQTQCREVWTRKMMEQPSSTCFQVPEFEK